MSGPDRADPLESIDCIDCGGRCHRLGAWDPAEPALPGDIVVYRCSDCLDAWYVEVPEPGGEAPAWEVPEG